MSFLRRTGNLGTSNHRRPGPVIGVDVGASAVRAAVLSFPVHDGVTHAVVEQIASTPLLPGTVVNGVVVDQAALSTALKTLWREQKLSGRSVILGVAGPQVQVRELRMPDLDPAQRARALPYQAREVVALPLDQVVLDFAALGAAPGSEQLVDGLLVASPRDPVTQLVRAVEAAGLSVARVDLSSFAVLRAVAQTGLAAEAVIDLGAHLTTVVVHAGGVPSLVRTLPRGGEEITRRLAERLGLDLDAAEALKCSDGLGGSAQAEQVVRELMTPLLADIRTSINYFRSGHAGVPIEHVTLTGGGALLAGLPRAVQDQVGLSTSIADHAQRLDASHRSRAGTVPDLSRGSALCIGLAMGAAA